MIRFSFLYLFVLLSILSAAFLVLLPALLLLSVSATPAECPLGWLSSLKPLHADYSEFLPLMFGTISGDTATLFADSSPEDQAIGLYFTWDGRIAGGFRASFQFQISDLAGMAGFALVLYADHSWWYHYENAAMPGQGSGLGYATIQHGIAIEVDLYDDDPSSWDGPAPHLSIHTAYDDGGNSARANTRISTQQNFTVKPQQQYLMIVEFDPVTKQLTARIGVTVVVANLDTGRAPFFGSTETLFDAIGFSASRYAGYGGQIEITNFQLSSVPYSQDTSQLIVYGNNGTFSSLTEYANQPQAIFQFKDACSVPIIPPFSQMSVTIKNSTGHTILPGPDGEIKWTPVGSQLLIFFYMKHSSLTAGQPRAANLQVTLNSQLWTISMPNITFLRVVPSASASILNGPSLIQIGVLHMFTLKLFNTDGVPAIYDNSSRPISYGLEVGGWIEKNATVNIADPTIVYLPIILRWYPDQLQTSFYIKFGFMKVKWSPVNVTLNYVPDPSTCEYTSKVDRNFFNVDDDFLYGPHGGSGTLFPYFLSDESKPPDDVWFSSAWLKKSFYLGSGFTWSFTYRFCWPMAVVLFQGDHPPNASDYSPSTYAQDLTAPLEGLGVAGLNKSFAIKITPRTLESGSVCYLDFVISNYTDLSHPIHLGSTVFSVDDNTFELTYQPLTSQLSVATWSMSRPQPETIGLDLEFLKSPLMTIGFTATVKTGSTSPFGNARLDTVLIDISQSFITFTQNNSITYSASAGFSSQPQAVLQILDACGRITLQSTTAQMTVIDTTPNSTRIIHTKIVPVPSKGQFQLYWYTLGADQPFQANLFVTVSDQPIKNTATTLTFVPSVPAKEQSKLPVNLTTMVAGASCTFQMSLRDQFNNIAVYDPTQTTFSYGALGDTLTTVTQVNETSPSTVTFAFSVSQVPQVNPLTFVIKYGSAVWASYPILIVSGEVDPSQTKFASISSSQSVGASQSLVISTFDAYMNPVPAIVASINFVFLFVSSEHPSGLSAFTHGVKPTGSLGYNGNSNNATLTVTSNVAGTHSLLVYVNNQVVSKISILVTTTLTPISSAVISTMQTIDSGRTDLQPAFTLDIFDAYLNPISTPAFAGLLFEVAINHNQRIDVTTLVSCLPTASLSPPLPSITPVQAWCIWNNTKLGYSVFVNSSVAGQYSVTSISPVGVRNISSSLLTVIAGPVNAAKSSVQLVNSTFTAGTFPLTIVLRDGFGQLRFGSDDASTIELLLLDSDTGGRIDGAMALTSNGSASYLLTNPPTLAGSYVLSIYIAGSPLSLTPGQVKLKVIPGEVAPLRTIYSLNNVAGSSSLIATATKPFNFTLITRDSYDNQLDHGGAKIELIGFTLIDDVSTTATSTAGGGGGGGTGSRRRLLALPTTSSTYSVIDHTDGTYTIIVTFPDSSANSKVPFQLLINGANAAATPSITIQPADPCLFTERVCPVSKKCVSLYSNYTSLYSHVCNSIMTIQSITPSITGTNGGGAPITIILSDAPDLNQPVIISVRGPSHSFLANATTQPQQLTQQSTQQQKQSTQKQFTFFLPPALTLGYGENEIPKGDSQGQQMSFTVDSQIDGIYYSVTTATSLRLINSSCFVVDYYWRVLTDECIPCPLNGYCPGGNQVYPLAGYYSNSAQDEEPKSCNPPLACKGYSVESFDSQTGKLLYDLASQCADGYQGKLCSQCDSAYYKDQQTCRSCGLDDTARRQLILVIILALVVFSVMALGVAFVDDSKLSLYIAVIVLIQHCSFVGSVGASHISASGLSEFFQFISLLNFEIAYFKLGCSVPQITYVKVFWATVLMIVIAAMMLILASGLFAMTRPISYLVEKEATRMKVWTRRMQNSLTILGVVVYLQMTTQFFKGLYCVDLDGQSVLQVEASTVCYEGGHLVTIIFIWPLLFIYSIGFPLLCCWLVLRTRRLNQWASSAAKYIYIYRGLKIRFIYFKCFNFITSFALALQITLSTTSNVTVRMATAFLFFSLDVFSIGVYWPYFKRSENLIAIGGGLANALSGLAILTILSSQSGLEEQKLGSLSGGPLFAVGLVVLIVLLLLIFPIRYLISYYFPSPESPEDDQLLLEAKYDELATSRSAKGLGTLHFETKKHAKKLATIGKSAGKALLPHLDDAASFGKAGSVAQVEMTQNPMVSMDIADVVPEIPQKEADPIPTDNAATHELASPSATSSPSALTINGHELGDSLQQPLPQNSEVADSGLASPSRFASPIEEQQRDEAQDETEHEE